MAIDWNDPNLNKALDEAEVDERIGDHTVVVDAVEMKTWDDGNVTYNVTCMIEDANFAKFYAKFGEPKTPAQLAEMKEAAKGNKALMGRYKGAASDTRHQKMLNDEYGLNDISQIAKGFRFRAKLIKDKNGYIRLAYNKAILPKGNMDGGSPTPDSDTPF